MLFAMVLTIQIRQNPLALIWILPICYCWGSLSRHSHFFERLLEIGCDVIDMLDTH